MSLLKSSKSPVDPSQFLRLLEQVLVKSGRVDLDLFQQQDACEILLCILEELFEESVQAAKITKCHIKTLITCNSCFQSNVKEDPFSILQLPISDSVQNSISLFLMPEELSGNNLNFCNSCQSQQPAVLEHQISKVGNFLIIEIETIP